MEWIKEIAPIVGPVGVVAIVAFWLGARVVGKLLDVLGGLTEAIRANTDTQTESGKVLMEIKGIVETKCKRGG